MLARFANWITGNKEQSTSGDGDDFVVVDSENGSSTETSSATDVLKRLQAEQVTGVEVKEDIKPEIKTEVDPDPLSLKKTERSSSLNSKSDILGPENYLNCEMHQIISYTRTKFKFSAATAEVRRLKKARAPLPEVTIAVDEFKKTRAQLNQHQSEMPTLIINDMALLEKLINSIDDVKSRVNKLEISHLKPYVDQFIIARDAFIQSQKSSSQLPMIVPFEVTLPEPLKCIGTESLLKQTVDDYALKVKILKMVWSSEIKVKKAVVNYEKAVERYETFLGKDVNKRETSPLATLGLHSPKSSSTVNVEAQRADSAVTQRPF